MTFNGTARLMDWKILLYMPSFNWCKYFCSKHCFLATKCSGRQCKNKSSFPFGMFGYNTVNIGCLETMFSSNHKLILQLIWSLREFFLIVYIHTYIQHHHHDHHKCWTSQISFQTLLTKNNNSKKSRIKCTLQMNHFAYTCGMSRYRHLKGSNIIGRMHDLINWAKQRQE